MSDAQSKASARISSGLRINRASDDAAGLAISEKMRGQIRGLERANQNAEDAINLTKIADGGLSEIQSMMHRMRELTIQAMNDTNTTSDKDKIQLEVNQLIKEIDNQANSTNYNTKFLLNNPSEIKNVPIIENVTSTQLEPIIDTITEIFVEEIIMNQISASVSTPPVSSSGQFQFFATNGNNELSRIVYGAEGGSGTSHPSIRVGGNVYNVQDLPRTQNTTYSGPPDMWSTTYNLNSGGYNLNIIQSVSVVANPQPPGGIGGQSYKIDYEVINNNPGAPVSFDFMYHVDTKLGANDQAPFRVGGTDVTTNTSYPASSITQPIEIFDDLSNPFLNGVIIVNDSVGFPIENSPDKVNIGNYGSVSNFNFTSSASAVGDSGYAVIWNNRTVTNSPYTLTTYYGVKNPPPEIMEQIGTEITTEVIVGYNEITTTEEKIVGWREEGISPELYIQTGANSDEGMYIRLCDARASSLGIDPLKIDPFEEAEASLRKLDTANDTVSEYRATFGANQNRLQHVLNVNSVTGENMSASKSRIQDSDMAKEMMELTRANILQEAGISMLAQANQSPQTVLKLIQ